MSSSESSAGTSNFSRALRWRRALLYSINSLRYVRLYCEMTPVHELAPFVAAFGDEGRVGGRHQHQRQQPDVVGQAFVFLAVALELLLCRLFMPQ